MERAIQRLLVECGGYVVVLLPHLRRMDVYAPLGCTPTAQELLRMPWRAVVRRGGGWAAAPVPERVRPEFLTAAAPSAKLA